MESNLFVLTEKKQEALTHREEVIAESERIFAEQYLIDWEEIRRELERERKYIREN